MPVIELSENKWGQVMSILADAPWKIANPLLMEIGEQLRHQATMKPQDIRVDANGQEASHGQ